MLIVGLTGNIAMGKSTVSATFINHNIPVIDADIIARQAVEPNSLGLKQIANTFSELYLNPDGSLNRPKLGQMVFSDPLALQTLNDIMSPLITQEATKQFNKLATEGHRLCVFDGALIIERGHSEWYRPLIVVHCTPEQQLARLMKRGTGHGPLTHDRAMAIINSQMPTEEKINLADYTIDTSQEKEYSIRQAEIIIEQLKQIKE